MSEEWPNGWYRGDPSQQAGPSFTPRPDAEGSPYEPTQAMPRGSAWPGQPPPRSWPGDGGPPRTQGPRGPRGWRRWVRPKRMLAILAALVVVLGVAAVGLYFDLNSKLTKVDVLTPTGLTSAGTNWLIAGSDSRGGLTKTEEDQLAVGHDISGGRSDTIMLLHMPSNGTRPTTIWAPTRRCQRTSSPAPPSRGRRSAWNRRAWPRPPWV